MKNKIMTVVGSFEVEVPYRISSEERTLMQITDAINKFFLPYLGASSNREDDLLDIVTKKITLQGNLTGFLTQNFSITAFEADEVAAHIRYDNDWVIAQKLLLPVVQNTLETKLFDSLRVGGGSAPRLTLDLKERKIEIE